VTTANIDSAVKRSIGYWYEDGLADFAIGGVLLAIGLLFFAELALPPATLGGLSSLGLPVIVIGGWFISGRLVRVGKERYVYPRTGYVDYRRARPKRRRAAMLLGAGIAIVVSLAVTIQPFSKDLIPALQGVLIDAMLAYVAYTADVDRYYVLGGLSAATGLTIAWSPLDVLTGSTVYFALIGMCAVLSGARTFRIYLRSTSPAAEV
jgi:hypothetical protein